MAENRTISKTKDDPLEYVIMYYKQQYNRIAELEKHRLAVSNTVFGVSILAVTFGFSETNKINTITGMILPTVVMFTNLFVLLYLRNTLVTILTHRERAKQVLKTYTRNIYEIDLTSQWGDGYSKFIKYWSQLRIQTVLHSILVLAALIPVLIYLGIIH